VYLESLSETIVFGKNFSKKLKPHSILLLKGPIGAGKTSFVQGIAQGLLIEESITSPTFSLSNHYDSGEIPLIHMDLYRLKDSMSAEELFLEEEEELNKNGGIMIIEWPELVIPIIHSYWLIELSYGKEVGRYYKIIDNQNLINP
tara:strand:+ start:5929 stop:6363 length:435 start_codon:yes stop_codon:yes gene_type:complete